MADAKTVTTTLPCCHGCDHREVAAPGDHCYMFHDAPDTYCAQHTMLWPSLNSGKSAAMNAFRAVMATLGSTRK